MAKNLLLLLLFVSVLHPNQVFSQLNKKFKISANDNVVYIFQSKHKKDKVSPQEIKDNALTVIRKLHQWNIPQIKIVQILHIKNLPRFVPQKIIRKKLKAKSKQFTKLILPMMNAEEISTFHKIKFHWYVDKRRKLFTDLNLSLSKPHLFIKSSLNDALKSSPKTLQETDFIKITQH